MYLAPKELYSSHAAISEKPKWLLLEAALRTWFWKAEKEDVFITDEAIIVKALQLVGDLRLQVDAGEMFSSGWVG